MIVFRHVKIRANTIRNVWVAFGHLTMAKYITILLDLFCALFCHIMHQGQKHLFMSVLNTVSA